MKRKHLPSGGCFFIVTYTPFFGASRFIPCVVPQRIKGNNMAKDYAKAFYKSAAWEKCRAGYISYVGGLCERCLAKGYYNAGVIVHHKIHLTPDNIEIPEITLSYNNLELLCLECHNREHFKGKFERRYIVDALGHIKAI